LFSVTGRPTLFAYATGHATSTDTCPRTHTVLRQCTLAEALSLAVAGDVIALATPSSTAPYIGNWTVETPGTSSTSPLTIVAALGIRRPVLDGNRGERNGCGTSSCNGPVLTIGQDVYLDMEDVVVQDANNPGVGGAINNALGGTVLVAATFRDNNAGEVGALANGNWGGKGTLIISRCTFVDNTAGAGLGINDGGMGGAIDNGDYGGSGTVVVFASIFSRNKADDGAAIDNADSEGKGTLEVSGSTFSGNVAIGGGGAIDNGDWGGTGNLTVSGTTFAANRAGGDGGAIDVGDNFGKGQLSVSESTFWGNSSYQDGGRDRHR
jgi:hypothetical protein